MFSSYSRTVFKRRSRKAKKVTSAGKELKLIDEDDVAENNGHVENTNNDVGPTSFDGDNSKTKKRYSITNIILFNSKTVCACISLCMYILVQKILLVEVIVDDELFTRDAELLLKRDLVGLKRLLVL